MTNKVQLCLIAVKNQVISLFGGEANFNLYLADNDGKFISATNDEKKYITCCHLEALLNPKYCNANTPGYAIIWDEKYTLICSFFGNSDACQEAANFINAAEGTQSFELLKPAAREKNKRNSEHLLDLSAKGKHPWQQPEFVGHHRKRTRDCLLDLSASGQHPLQQPEMIERERENHSKRANESVAQGKHNFVTDHPAKKRLKNLFEASESTHYTDIDDKTGEYHRQWPNKAWPPKKNSIRF